MLNRNFMLQNHSVKWYKYNRGEIEAIGTNLAACRNGPVRMGFEDLRESDFEEPTYLSSGSSPT